MTRQITPENADNYILSIEDLKRCVQNICQGASTIRVDLTDFFLSIHAVNVKAGWWSDLQTGEPKQRNFGELAALIWSEIGEAITAAGPDDKLPQYDGQMVEIGDALIRQADLFGSRQLGNLVAAVELTIAALEKRGVSGQSVESTQVIEKWLAFFEAGRKGRIEVLQHHADLFAYLIRAAQARYNAQTYMSVKPELDIAPIWEILGDKVAFNTQRPDHKIENRQAEGGKKI